MMIMRHFVPATLAIACIVLMGCSNTPDSERKQNHNKAYGSQHQPLISSLFDQTWAHWQGVPYRYGGTSINGIDCSAFVQVAMKNAYNLVLPRTTQQQIKQGVTVEWERKRVGDLVFFRNDDRSLHVGIYLGEARFMHASTSKGVIISRLDSPYWATRLLKIKRVA